MLAPVAHNKLSADDYRFAIVASLYNAKYVDAMLNAAKAELKQARARDVEVIRVPGAYEIPVIAAELAERAKRLHAIPAPDAILCLGVILRGETVHAAHIGDAVSRALMQIQVEHRLPVIHEVLLLENEAQAKARCLDKDRNRGAEAAQTAIAMAHTLARLRDRAREGAAEPAPMHKLD